LLVIKLELTLITYQKCHTYYHHLSAVSNVAKTHLVENQCMLKLRLFYGDFSTHSQVS